MSARDWTPRVRDAALDACGDVRLDGPEFDRWLAEVEREALRQAAQIAYSYGRKPAAVPMERIIADDIAHRIETRAAEIREGGTR